MQDRGFAISDITAEQLVGDDVVASQTAAAAWVENNLQGFFSQLEKKESWDNKEKPSLLAGAGYVLLNDGGGKPAKRLRPWFLLMAGVMMNVPLRQVYHLALSIEMIHGYSLVHDDLPAMDDDAMRRGKPTLHRAFLDSLSAKDNEAFAILVGDLLQSLAFEFLAQGDHVPAEKKNILLGYLAKAAGQGGMVSGQWRDIVGAKTIEEANQLKSQKTGALIELSLTAPLLLMEKPNANHNANHKANMEKSLLNLAKTIGVLYQAVDDMMDEVVSSETMGKKTGKDRMAGKSTTIALHGMAAARDEMNQWMAAVEIAGKEVGEELTTNVIEADGKMARAALEHLLAWLRGVVSKI